MLNGIDGAYASVKKVEIPVLRWRDAAPCWIEVREDFTSLFNESFKRFSEILLGQRRVP